MPRALPAPVTAFSVRMVMADGAVYVRADGEAIIYLGGRAVDRSREGAPARETALARIDEAVAASELVAHLRARGIVDIGAYRGVGVNQLRIGTWPSVEIEDVEALLACIDYCLERVL